MELGAEHLQHCILANCFAQPYAEATLCCECLLLGVVSNRYNFNPNLLQKQKLGSYKLPRHDYPLLQTGNQVS